LWITGYGVTGYGVVGYRLQGCGLQVTDYRVVVDYGRGVKNWEKILLDFGKVFQILKWHLCGNV
jgi:hypothetical protein